MDHADVTSPDSQATKAPLNPVAVGLALFFFFPLGLYLLWKHPVLSSNRTWWWVGGIWSLFVLVSAMSGDKDKKASTDKPVVVAHGEKRTQEAGSELRNADAAERIASVPGVPTAGETPGVHPLFFDESGRRSVYRELKEGSDRIEAEATERFGASTKEDNLRGVLLGDKRLTEKSKWQVQRLMELYDEIRDRHGLPDAGLGEISKEAEDKGW